MLPSGPLPRIAGKATRSGPRGTGSPSCRLTVAHLSFVWLKLRDSRRGEVPPCVRPVSVPRGGGTVTGSVARCVRVSTVDQDLAGPGRELRAEAGRRSRVVAVVSAEKVTGTGRVERAEYDQLLKDAAIPGRRWPHLLVWSLGRFSREAPFTRAAQALLDLEKSGVPFHSLKEPTLDTPEDGEPNLGRDGGSPCFRSSPPSSRNARPSGSAWQCARSRRGGAERDQVARPGDHVE